MKKIIVIGVLIIAAFFWSPWMGGDGGENVIRMVQQELGVKAEMEELVSKYSYKIETGEGCDGLSSEWAPFGRRVKYCEYGSWYISFWGQYFQNADEYVELAPLAPVVEELQVQKVPESFKQDKTEDSVVDDVDKVGVKLYRGAWFDVEYPEDFEVRPTLPITNYNGQEFIQTDEAYFSSPDGSVEFFVYSPLWSGEPEDYLIVAPHEEIVSEKTEVGPALDHQLKESKRIILWTSLKSKDNSYYRSYVSIKEQVKANDSSSELHHVFGIKYQDEEAYQQYKDAYVSFKESLDQYAD